MRKTVKDKSLAKAEAKSWAGIIAALGADRARTDPDTGELCLTAGALSELLSVPPRTLTSWALPSVHGPGRASWHRWAVCLEIARAKAAKRRGDQYGPVDPLSPEVVRREAMAAGASDEAGDRAYLMASTALRDLNKRHAEIEAMLNA